MINEKELQEFFDKGNLAFEKKNYDYAIEIFSQILASKYDHLEARHFLHVSLLTKTENVKISPVSKSVNEVMKFLVTLSAENLLRKGNIPGALEKFEKILTAEPHDTYAYKKIAEVFYEKNMFAHALQNLEEAKSVDSKDISVLKKLGEIYLRKENYKKAKFNYEAALKINPNDGEILKSLKNLDALGTIQKDFGS